MESKRRRRYSFDAAIVATDLLAVALALPCTYLLRFHNWFPIAPRGDWDPVAYWRIYPIAVLAWIVSLAAVQIYRRGHEILSTWVFQQIIKGSLLAIAIVIALTVFARSGESYWIADPSAFARILAPLALVISVAFISGGRLAVQAVVRRLQERKGLGLRRLLVFGTGELALDVVRHLHAQKRPILRLVGYVADDPTAVGEMREGGEVVGYRGELPELLARLKIDDMILADPTLTPEEALGLMLDCEKEIVVCRTVPNLFQMRLAEVPTQPIDGVPLYGLKETPLHGFNAVVKRAFDFVVALVGLIVTLPGLLLIAAAIRRDSPGSILFKQKRVGLDGRRYNLYKFRSMVEDAEGETGPVWATENDPRRTRVGRFLRRWNLDELPQLINVLRGDMSLVGPRPERPFFVKQFKEQLPRYMARHKVKSGLTGWAQVHGLRGDSSIRERLAYDLYYIENWSFWLDVKILIMTIRAWRRGAH